MRFLGIDGAPGGWILIGLDEGHGASHQLVSTLESAITWLAKAQQTLIDMPIGLAELGPEQRHADGHARTYLGTRRSSVFPVPCRAALEASTYEEASRTNHQFCGRKLSKQTWNIMGKIAELDLLMRNNRHLALRESHPEVCFTALNRDQPMLHNKKSVEGRSERLSLLTDYLSDAENIFEDVRSSYLVRDLADDDIIDALILALSARLGTQRGFISLPDEPVSDQHSLPMEIVYPLIGAPSRKSGA